MRYAKKPVKAVQLMPVFSWLLVNNPNGGKIKTVIIPLTLKRFQ